MEYQVSHEQLDPQPVMSVRGEVRFEDIPRAIGDYLAEVVAHVEAAGGVMVGPPFTRYHEINFEDVLLEAGLPVAAPLAPAGRVEAAELPGGDAAATLHVGPYERLPEAGAALREWAEAHGWAVSGAGWEVYVNDPGEVSGPEEYQTRLFVPLARADEP
jgi:effector-binding domain-containing protein